MHAVELERKLGRNGEHEHNAQDGRTHGIFIGSGMARPDHFSPALILVHGVNDETNGHRQENNPVQL